MMFDMVIFWSKILDIRTKFDDHENNYIKHHGSYFYKDMEIEMKIRQ